MIIIFGSYHGDLIIIMFNFEFMIKCYDNAIYSSRLQPAASIGSGYR